MKNTEASTLNVKGHALSPTAQRLLNLFETFQLDINQTSKATGVAVQTLRNNMTTAKIARGLCREDLLSLRGYKVGRKRYWHIEIVADWLDEIEGLSRRPLSDEATKMIQESIRAGRPVEPTPAQAKPVRAKSKGRGRRRKFDEHQHAEAQRQAIS
ncbi:MAG: hypothetical protein JAY75_05055 [Candidatus Thiodiazotropha taylori]|nr:hypothetical protein [Candidatus Thiodiazotropha taylori]MCW4226202.1 hypothetical protein [Candidatus Thiodiazotropha endolucinida]MCG7882937.1 hypothetical protein [Candidatus Thiodiazotropha taylori]MCG7887767.1 hypothetical protein [Candidatus Thiodiazotropha taylori]MCG7892249.1 hypothetical protein [Candidatus Thiodiazotropha taylori]